MKIYLFLLCTLFLSGCSSPQLNPKPLKAVARDVNGNYHYRLAPADVLSIFVWRNEDISGVYTIRPDGQINMPLTSPVVAEGLTTTELENVIEKSLSALIKSPEVSVVIQKAVGNSHEHVRIIGESSTPYSTIYQKGMTLLDLVTQAGGLSPYAAGNRAELIRTHNGVVSRHPLRIDDLINDADLSANIELEPGDFVKIPQAYF